MDSLKRGGRNIAKLRVCHAISARMLREGFQKNTANYPHFVDKGGGGSSNVDRQWGKGGRRIVDKKNSLM